MHESSHFIKRSSTRSQEPVNLALISKTQYISQRNNTISAETYPPKTGAYNLPPFSDQNTTNFPPQLNNPQEYPEQNYKQTARLSKHNPNIEGSQKHNYNNSRSEKHLVSKSVIENPLHSIQEASTKSINQLSCTKFYTAKESLSMKFNTVGSNNVPEEKNEIYKLKAIILGIEIERLWRMIKDYEESLEQKNVLIIDLEKTAEKQESMLENLKYNIEDLLKEKAEPNNKKQLQMLTEENFKLKDNVSELVKKNNMLTDAMQNLFDKKPLNNLEESSEPCEKCKPIIKEKDQKIEILMEELERRKASYEKELELHNAHHYNSSPSKLTTENDHNPKNEQFLKILDMFNEAENLKKEVFLSRLALTVREETLINMEKDAKDNIGKIIEEKMQDYSQAIEKLKGDNNLLFSDNQSLSAHNNDLQTQNAEQERLARILEDQVNNIATVLKAENDSLKNENEFLKNENLVLKNKLKIIQVTNLNLKKLTTSGSENNTKDLGNFMESNVVESQNPEHFVQANNTGQTNPSSISFMNSNKYLPGNDDANNQLLNSITMDPSQKKLGSARYLFDEKKIIIEEDQSNKSINTPMDLSNQKNLNQSTEPKFTIKVTQAPDTNLLDKKGNEVIPKNENIKENTFDLSPSVPNNEKITNAPLSTQNDNDQPTDAQGGNHNKSPDNSDFNKDDPNMNFLIQQDYSCAHDDCAYEIIHHNAPLSDVINVSHDPHDRNRSNSKDIRHEVFEESRRLIRTEIHRSPNRTITSVGKPKVVAVRERVTPTKLNTSPREQTYQHNMIKVYSNTSPNEYHNVYSGSSYTNQKDLCCHISNEKYTSARDKLTKMNFPSEISNIESKADLSSFLHTNVEQSEQPRLNERYNPPNNNILINQKPDDSQSKPEMTHTDFKPKTDDLSNTGNISEIHNDTNVVIFKHKTSPSDCKFDKAVFEQSCNDTHKYDSNHVNDGQGALATFSDLKPRLDTLTCEEKSYRHDTSINKSYDFVIGGKENSHTISVDFCKKDLDDLKHQNDNLLLMNKHLEIKLENLIENMNCTTKTPYEKNELLLLNNDLTQLHSYKDLVKKYEGLLKKNQDLLINIDMSQADYKNEITMKESKLKQAKEELNNSKKKLTDIEDSRVSLKKECIEKSSQLEMIKNENLIQDEKIRMLVRELEESKDQLNRLEGSKVRKLESDIEYYENKWMKCEKEISDLNDLQQKYKDILQEKTNQTTNQTPERPIISLNEEKYQINVMNSLDKHVTASKGDSNIKIPLPPTRDNNNTSDFQRNKDSKRDIKNGTSLNNLFEDKENHKTDINTKIDNEKYFVLVNNSHREYHQENSKSDRDYDKIFNFVNSSREKLKDSCNHENDKLFNYGINSSRNKSLDNFDKYDHYRDSSKRISITNTTKVTEINLTDIREGSRNNSFGQPSFDEEICLSHNRNLLNLSPQFSHFENKNHNLKFETLLKEKNSLSERMMQLEKEVIHLEETIKNKNILIETLQRNMDEFSPSKDESDYKLKQICDDFKNKEEQIDIRNNEIKQFAEISKNLESNHDKSYSQNDTIMTKLGVYDEKIAEQKKNQDQLIGELIENKDLLKEKQIENDKLREQMNLNSNQNLSITNPPSKRKHRLSSNAYNTSKTECNITIVSPNHKIYANHNNIGGILEKLNMEKFHLTKIRVELDEIRDYFRVDTNNIKQNLSKLRRIIQQVESDKYKSVEASFDKTSYQSLKDKMGTAYGKFNQKITLLTKENEDLQEKVESTTKANDDLSSQVYKLENQNETLTYKLEQKESIQMKSEEDEFATIEKSLKEEKHIVQKLKHEIENLKKEKNNALEALDDFRKRLILMKKQEKHNEDAHIVNSQIKNQQQIDEENAYKESIEKLKEQIKFLEKKVERKVRKNSTEAYSLKENFEADRVSSIKNNTLSNISDNLGEELQMITDPKTGKLKNTDIKFNHQELINDKKKTLELINQLIHKLYESENSKTNLQNEKKELQIVIHEQQESINFMKEHYDTEVFEKDQILIDKVQSMEDQLKELVVKYKTKSKENSELKKQIELLEVEKLKGFCVNWDQDDRINIVRSKLAGIIKKLMNDLNLVEEFKVKFDEIDNETFDTFVNTLEHIGKEEQMIENVFVHESVSLCKKSLDTIEHIEEMYIRYKKNVE